MIEALVQGHLAVVAQQLALLGRRGFVRERYREDLEAAALVGLFQAAARFDPARGVPFAAWAAQRVRGALFDEVRRQQPLTRSEWARTKTSDYRRYMHQIDEIAWSVPAADVRRDPLLERAFERALLRLPARDAKLLRLLYWQELTLKAAGHHLSLSETRASQLHARALRRLAHALAAEGVIV